MNFTHEILYKTNRTIIDADVSSQMMAILHKGKGENIVTVNDCDVFTVSAHSYMIRILDEELVIYDGESLQFFTLDGKCMRKVKVGSHLFDLLPMKGAVACTYRDQGVYGHELGEERIVVVYKDGTVKSQRSFANDHQLDFDIRFARVKHYTCMSKETNTIVHFTADFKVQKTVSCPFELEDFIVMSYQYPYYIFIEENRVIFLHENGTYEETNRSFSYNVRSAYHRGPFVFLEILEDEVIGWKLT